MAGGGRAAGGRVARASPAEDAVEFRRKVSLGGSKAGLRISQITPGVDFEDFRGFLNSFRIFDFLVKSHASARTASITPPRDGSIRAIQRSRSQFPNF